MVKRSSRPHDRKSVGPPGSSDSEFDAQTVSVTRVARMVAGGRRFRFRAFVAVGNHNGKVGIGLGKAADVPRAVEKATRRARSSCIAVPRSGGTIPRDIVVKRGAVRILMRPARPGHGIVAGGVIRTLSDLAGITDISAKILSRSTNDIANAQAVMAAFEKLSRHAEAVKLRAKRQ